MTVNVHEIKLHLEVGASETLPLEYKKKQKAAVERAQEVYEQEFPYVG